MVSALFLGSLRVSLLLGALLPHTHQPGITPDDPKLPVGTTLNRFRHIALLDLGDASSRPSEGEGGSNSSRGLYLSHLRELGLALLDLCRLEGEENQAGLVSLEALDVGGEGFLGEVLAATVDGDANLGGFEAGDASGLMTGMLARFIFPPKC